MVLDLGLLADVLHERSEILLFLVIAFGILLGRLRFGPVELGATAGVLFAGLIFGHFGYRISPFTETMGFIFFIYSVGVQAGPRFMGVFLEDGAKYFLLALVVGATGFLLAVGASVLFGFEQGISAGLLGGALTSTPTLAAAQSFLMQDMPAGAARTELIENITTSYAITYVFGLVGLILFFRFLPTLLRLDMAAEAARLERGSRRRGGSEEPSLFLVRAYRVDDDELVGRSIGDIQRESDWTALIQRVKRGGELVDVTPDLTLEKGDLVSGVVRGESFGARDAPGAEVFDKDLIDLSTETVDLVVTRGEAAGRTLRDLGIMESYGCFVNRLSRLGVELPVSADARLEKGDVLKVTGVRERLDLVGDELGHIERDVEETDLFTFALGIVLGLGLGSIVIRVGGVDIGLGMAGGLLVAGLALGFLRSLQPTFGRLPGAARWVFMELGLLFFMAGVGLRAGGGILEALGSVGPALFLCGVMVTLVPVLLGYAFGRLVLGLHPVLLLGGITGSMTSTPSLNILTSTARSSLPALGYTGAYAFANVLLTVAGSVIVRL